MIDMVPNKWEEGARRASGGHAGLRVYPGGPTRGQRAMSWDFPTSVSNAPNGNSSTKIPGMYKREQPNTHVLAIHDHNV